MNDDYFEFTDKRAPYWFCEECGHKSKTKPMPIDREKFYQQVKEKGAPICPRCKSESFLPVGY